MSTVSDNLDKVLDVLLDNLQKPNFDKDELEKLKELVIARLKVEDDSPQKIANRQITQLLYPSKHPYYIPSVDERIKAIETINIDDVKKFYQEHYNKENLYVSIVGDIKKAKAQEIVSSLFADLNKDFKSKNIRPEIEVVNNKKTSHEDVLKPDKTQSEIVIAHTGEVDRSHKDFYPLYVANFALGGSALSSRLGTVVRDDNGLVYNVRSSFNAGIGAGMYKIILGCNPKNVAKAIKITKETIDQFVQSGISELELKMTKSFMTGSLPVRNLSSMEDIAETLLQMLIYDLGENYIKNYNENMSSISKKQVDAAAKTYIKTDDFSSVVVGPAYQ
jgi:zinc protease